MFNTGPDRRRTLLAGRRWVCAALSGGALITVVTLSIGTAAGTAQGSTTNPQPTPSQIATARHYCERILRRIPANAPPKVVDNKDGLYVSFWPTQVTCIFSSSGNGADTYTAPSKGLAPDAIQRLSGAIDLCTSDCVPASTTNTTNTTSTRAVVDATFLDGVLGQDVTGVTVDLTNGHSVTATVENGHYLAWWDSDDNTVTGTKAIVTLRNGETSSVPVPPSLGVSCRFRGLL